MDKSHVIKDNRGFTLIEVLVALSILAVALFGLLSMVGSTLRATESGKRQTQAVHLASEKLEMIKAIPYNNIQQSGDGTQSGDQAVIRSCAGASPTFTCTPSGANGTDSDPTVNIGNMLYTWQWVVTYIDLDGDGVLEEANEIADSGDIKKIDMTVTWTDLLGLHNTTLTVLRKL